MAIDYNRLTGPQRKILREALMRLFRRARSLDLFLEEQGFESLADFVEDGPFKHQVFDLITELARVGKLDDFMERATAEYAESPHLEDLEARLALADEAADRQRVVGARGLERTVRAAGVSDLFVWADKLVRAGRRVAYVSYPVAAGEVVGSGFLVGPDRLLTNYHVVERLITGTADPADVRVKFGYAKAAAGVAPDEGETFGLAARWLLAQSRYSDADLAPGAGLPRENELDFALLELDRPAGETRGWFDLAEAAEPRRDDSIVFVLQHPRGKPLKQSIGVLKPSPSPVRLRYDADTESGSSGSPVFDQRLNLLALHHAGDPNFEIEAEYNQGIPLGRIRAALAAG